MQAKCQVGAHCGGLHSGPITGASGVRLVLLSNASPVSFRTARVSWSNPINPIGFAVTHRLGWPIRCCHLTTCSVRRGAPLKHRGCRAHRAHTAHAGHTRALVTVVRRIAAVDWLGPPSHAQAPSPSVLVGGPERIPWAEQGQKGRATSVGFLWLCCVSGTEFRARERLGQRVLQTSKATIYYREEESHSFLLPPSDHRRSACCPRALPQTRIFHSPILLFALLLFLPKLCFLHFLRLCCLVVCERNWPAPDRPPQSHHVAPPFFLPPGNRLPAAIGCLAAPARPR